MLIKRGVIVIFLLISMFTVGSMESDVSLQWGEETEVDIILRNRSIKFNEFSKICNILKRLRGNNYYKESKTVEEYEEKILDIHYSINSNLGESDYINFWDDMNKREILITNSVYMFLMINDLDKIRIKLDDPISEEFVINRSQVEYVYHIALENYNISEENLSVLITKDNIEELWYLVNS